MPPPNERHRSVCRAFTLVELTVVLLLMAVLAGVVAVSFAASVRTARLEDVIRQIESFDHLARDEAVRFDRPVARAFRVSQGALVRLDPAAQDEGTVIWRLGSTVRIDRVMVEGDGAADRDATVRYSRLGYSPTYAVQLSDTKGNRRWLVVAGLSGSTRVTNDEMEVRHILAQAGSARHNAD